MWGNLFFYLIDLSFSIMRGVEICKVKGIANAKGRNILTLLLSKQASNPFPSLGHRTNYTRCSQPYEKLEKRRGGGGGGGGHIWMM